MTDESREEEGIPELKSVLVNFTPEQLAFVQGKARELVSRDATVNQVATVLIAARRVYSLARLRLHQILTEQEGHKWEDGIEECLVQAMANEADKEFTVEDLVGRVNGSVTPFVIEELHMAQEAARTKALMADQEQEQARLARKIPLTLINSGVTEVERGQVHIFCGPREHMPMIDGVWAPVVMANKTDELPYYVLRLLERPQSELVDREELLTRVVGAAGVNKWMNRFTGTQKTKTTLTDLASKSMCKPKIDLLVVQDGHSLRTEGPSWREKGMNTLDGLKHLYRWAKEAKAVVLCYVPYEADEQEEQARFIEKAQEHYEIYVL
jgi:hypothetical protein